jgi:phenylalanyl-tRNA synthetase beta subunit
VLFDVYRPTKPDASLFIGEKSMAVRLILQSHDDTNMTDAQIEEMIDKVVGRLAAQFQARLRS